VGGGQSAPERVRHRHSDFSPENPGNPLIPKPGWKWKFSSFVVHRRRVNN
jgi:hypothetical protein